MRPGVGPPVSRPSLPPPRRQRVLTASPYPSYRELTARALRSSSARRVCGRGACEPCEPWAVAGRLWRTGFLSSRELSLGSFLESFSLVSQALTLCTTNVLSTLLLFFNIYLKFQKKNTNTHSVITTKIDNIGTNFKNISNYQLLYHVVRKNFFLVNWVFENK